MGSTNLPAKMYSSGERTQRVLRFEINDGNSGTKYIDLAKALSLVNRKMYRQGCYYYVSGIEFADNGATDGSTLDVITAPDNWVTKNSWIRGYQKWNEINDKVDVENPKYHDFKIMLDSTDPSAATLLPNGIGTQSFTQDEWILSTYNLPDTGNSNYVSMGISLMGNHVGSFPDQTRYSLIKGYGNTRNRISIRSDQPAPDVAAEDVLMLHTTFTTAMNTLC